MFESLTWYGWLLILTYAVTFGTIIVCFCVDLDEGPASTAYDFVTSTVPDGVSKGLHAILGNRVAGGLEGCLGGAVTWACYKRNPLLQGYRAHVLEVMSADVKALKENAKAAQDPKLLSVEGFKGVAKEVLHAAEEVTFAREMTQARRGAKGLRLKAVARLAKGAAAQAKKARQAQGEAYEQAHAMATTD